ncbi:hypothetical protein E5288_WYG007838 [Bos mutus]|uniref:Uncharacterized protein n=1 Tax=Bos mutus TaxID=72004 RepID=A0A6B0RK40_9CETA|nr:hypothetical protein [Bos mutus]
MGSSLGLCFTVSALGASEAGPPVAFLLALLLMGLAPLKAQEPPCMAVPAAQAAAAIDHRSSGSTMMHRCRGQHQLRELCPSKVPPPPSAEAGARSPPNTAGHRFHPPHTLWMSPQ